MSLKELLRRIAMQFFVTYTATMAITIIILKYSPGEQPEITVDFLRRMMLFSLCAVLPGIVYYSKGELSKKQWWIRTAVHTVLLETVLLSMGAFWGMYQGIGGMVLFAAIILAVDLFVGGVSYINDRGTADEVNKALKERRKYNKSIQEDTK